MGAKVPNPRKQFQFNVIIPGLDPFLVQEVKTPDTDFDVATHGDAGYEIKTAGLRKVGTLTIMQIQRADIVDYFMRDWANRILNYITGGGTPPSLYKVSIIVEEFGNDGISVIDRHIYNGCWPMKINGKELKRMGSENTMRTIEFSVDDVGF
jgi:hypothetical protein